MFTDKCMLCKLVIEAGFWFGSVGTGVHHAI